MEIRGVKFRVGSEWRVGGLYWPSRAVSTPAVLMLHGFPGVQQNEDIATELCHRGFTVFIPHFSGCWGSSGQFHVYRLLEDALAAYDLLSRYHHVDPRLVAVLGYSVGGWVALKVAAERRTAAVVAMAPAVPGTGKGGGATSDYVRQSARVVNILSPAQVWSEYQESAAEDHPEQYIPRISPSPILFVQGRDDSLVLPRSTEALFAMARGPKELIQIDGEGHEFQTSRQLVVKEVCEWLQTRAAVKAGDGQGSRNDARHALGRPSAPSAASGG